MSRLRPNEQRAKFAAIIIWIIMGISIIRLVSLYLQNELLDKASKGGFISEEVANTNDSREVIIQGFFIVFYIISAITFIMWFRRAYFNLHLKVKNLAHTEGWAAGSWFIPIMNLGRPYNIMKEMFEETTILLEKGELTKKITLNFNLINWWWALWIIEGVSDRVLSRYLKNHDKISDLILITNWQFINSTIMIPLSIITVLVIKKYAFLETKLRLLPTDSLNQEITYGDNDILDSGF